MTERRYVALTTACDMLLGEGTAKSERVAVSWLHVLNEHPNNLRRYKAVFDRSARLAAVSRGIRAFMTVSKTFVRSLLNTGRNSRDESIQIPGNLDLLIVSHLVSAHWNPESPDFYFGNLPAQLASSGLNSLVVLINHLPAGQRRIRQTLTRTGTVSRIVLPVWFGLSVWFRLMRRAVSIASELKCDAARMRSPFDKSVALEAAHQAVSASTIKSLWLHDHVKHLCARFRPRALMVTWEGHAWERLAFDAARSVDPAVRCIGYQHSVLLPKSHALRRSLGPQYDPDCLVTAGDVTRDILETSGELRNIPLLTYGTHRRSDAAAPRGADAATRCLVIPEGLESECLRLFKFALAAAAMIPDIGFVLRTHPVLPMHKLARRHAQLRTFPKNVEVTDKPAIADDFARCDWALYRGSSAAVHAVLAGVRPVFVLDEPELPIDPLFALAGWRQQVTRPSEFAALVAADRATALEDRRKEWEPARAFCDRYTVPPDVDVLKQLLAS